MEILDQLHIPPEKTTDLSEFCDEDGKLRYGLRYRVAGRVLKRPPEHGSQSENGLWCMDGPSRFYPCGAEGFPKPCFDLCWEPWLPWVLDETIGGPKKE